MTETIWSPTAARIENSALREYLNWLEKREGRPFPDHDAFQAWSVEDLDRFWVSIVDYFEVAFSTPWSQVRTADPMPHTRWFTGARLNWAEHALRNGADDATALLCVQEGGRPAREITFGELRRRWGRRPAWLRRAGRAARRPGRRLPAEHRARGDRLVGRRRGRRGVGVLLPDFGAEGTIGRLAQLEPSVLIAADGYHWNGKDVDRSDVVAQLRANMPTVRHSSTCLTCSTGRTPRARHRGTS